MGGGPGGRKICLNSAPRGHILWTLFGCLHDEKSEGAGGMASRRIRFRVHAIRRMFERRITEEEVSHVLSAGEVVEEYQDDEPYPSRLILGWCERRPIHVVAAENKVDGETIVVTVYEPDAEVWESDFRRKRK